MTRKVASMSAGVGGRPQTISRVPLDPPPPFSLKDQLQSLPLAAADGGEADVHDVNADVDQLPGELVLVVGAEGEARRLLAGAERVIVDPDPLGGGKDEVVGEPTGVPGQLFKRFLKLDL